MELTQARRYSTGTYETAGVEILHAHFQISVPRSCFFAASGIAHFRNNCCQELKKVGIHLEKINRPTQDAMCKTLFLDHDWPVTKAKRLAALGDGDWRRLWALDRLLQGAGVNVAECKDGDSGSSF